jgi:hypothetical protein
MSSLNAWSRCRLRQKPRTGGHVLAEADKRAALAGSELDEAWHRRWEKMKSSAHRNSDLLAEAYARYWGARLGVPSRPAFGGYAIVECHSREQLFSARLAEALAGLARGAGHLWRPYFLTAWPTAQSRCIGFTRKPAFCCARPRE